MTRPRMSGQLYMTQITEASRRRIVQKPFKPPIRSPVKISPPKVEKPAYGTEFYHHAIFHADRPRYLSPGINKQKIHIFPYRPTFLERCRRAT